MPTEAEIRQWVRDERERIKREEQAACKHLESGTLNKDWTVTCNQCGAVLKYEGE